MNISTCNLSDSQRPTAIENSAAGVHHSQPAESLLRHRRDTKPSSPRPPAGSPKALTLEADNLS